MCVLSLTTVFKCVCPVSDPCPITPAVDNPPVSLNSAVWHGALFKMSCPEFLISLPFCSEGCYHHYLVYCRCIKEAYSCIKKMFPKSLPFWKPKLNKPFPPKLLLVMVFYHNNGNFNLNINWYEKRGIAGAKLTMCFLGEQ